MDISRWLRHSVGLTDLCYGGRVSVAEEFIVVSEEFFVLSAIMLVLHVSLRLAPGGKGMVELDGLSGETRSENA